MYISNIKIQTKENTFFRHVLETGKYQQVVLMSLPENTDIGEEVHPHTDQLFYFMKGKGQVICNGETMPVKKHDVFLVPAGARHNIQNTGDEDLKLFTIYAPPQHPNGTIHKTKEDAQKDEQRVKGGE